MPCVTCEGSCCAVFPFGDPDSPKFDKHNGNDAAFIRDMLVPLSLVEAAERLETLGVDPFWVDDAQFDWSGRYVGNNYRRLMKCRHWDTETRLCTVYEQRPQMCREYPYLGGKCDYGCGYELPFQDAWDVALRQRGPEGGTPFNIVRGYN